MKKYLISYFLLLAVLYINVSAHKSIWPNCNYLSNNDKSICVQFHYLKGSNRIAEFRKIASTIFKQDNFISEKKCSTDKLNLYDLIQILGEPDEKKGNKVVYYLSSETKNIRAEIDENIQTNEITCTTYGIK